MPQLPGKHDSSIVRVHILQNPMTLHVSAIPGLPSNRTLVFATISTVDSGTIATCGTTRVSLLRATESVGEVTRCASANAVTLHMMRGLCTTARQPPIVQLRGGGEAAGSCSAGGRGHQRRRPPSSRAGAADAGRGLRPHPPRQLRGGPVQVSAAPSTDVLAQELSLHVASLSDEWDYKTVG